MSLFKISNSWPNNLKTFNCDQLSNLLSNLSLLFVCTSLYAQTIGDCCEVIQPEIEKFAERTEETLATMTTPDSQ